MSADSIVKWLRREYARLDREAWNLYSHGCNEAGAQRDSEAERFHAAAEEIEKLRIDLSNAPCKRAIIQQWQYADCFPEKNCLGCDCWRKRSGS